MDTVIHVKKNPLFPHTGLCDPHMRVFGDRVYLYASHDYSPESTDFNMHDWQVWSTADMIEWRYECTIRPEDTYMGESHECWAPDAIERNGTYYFYFSECVHSTGVMVADHPGGPFKDALGKPLLPKGLTPTNCYDPTVFVDDDPRQAPYIMFGIALPGHGGYHIARLNDDMISLAEEPRKVELNGLGDDKPTLHKRNGTYYLTFQSFYATSDSVYGPYTLRGNTGVAPDHGSYFEWNNQWFHAYGVPDPTMVYRSSHLTYVHYRDNGDMVEDQMIAEFGVGQYDARWRQIHSAWYMACQGVDKLENARSSFELCNARDGSWVAYPNIHNMPENATISLFGACRTPRGCTLEIHAETPDGPLLGSLSIQPWGGDGDRHDWRGYTIFQGQLSNPAGTNSLVFVYRGDGDDLFRHEWFRIL